jgi:hypothetical protein
MLVKTLSTALALVAVFAVVTSASAGRAWCRADPVLIVDGDVVDIQVSSSLEMFGSATGPIQMVVKVERGTRANVLLQDFGFGYGYNIKIETVRSLERGVLAQVEIFAPARDSSLPVTVHGTHISTNVLGFLFGQQRLLWFGNASGSANQWITLQVR